MGHSGAGGVPLCGQAVLRCTGCFRLSLDVKPLHLSFATLETSLFTHSLPLQPPLRSILTLPVHSAAAGVLDSAPSKVSVKDSGAHVSITDSQLCP